MDSLPHRYLFISGLPRSGSTLLAGLLRQNNRWHAAMSSPVSNLMNSCLEQIGAGSEFYTFFDESRRRALVESIFSSYYQPQSDKSIIFDTSRMWTARLHQLVELFDDVKVVCCVRNPAWVMDSFERIYRKNPFDYSRMFSPNTRMTVYSRCESLAQSNGTLGSAWTGLKEAYYGEFSDRLLLLDYDILTQFPSKSMQLVYEFLGVEAFSHDFQNVEYEENDFDQKLGVKGLHTVKREVKFSPRKTVLPPDLFKKYSEMAFWLDGAGTNASIISAKSSAN